MRSICAISNDLERTLTLFSRSHHSLALNISQTATDTAIVSEQTNTYTWNSIILSWRTSRIDKSLPYFVARNLATLRRCRFRLLGCQEDVTVLASRGGNLPPEQLLSENTGQYFGDLRGVPKTWLHDRQQRLILSVSKPSISQRSQIKEDTVEPSVPAREFNIKAYTAITWHKWSGQPGPQTRRSSYSQVARTATLPTAPPGRLRKISKTPFYRPIKTRT